MKFIAKLILIALFVPLFLIALLTATFRFKLLNYSFWQNTLDHYNVYATLADNYKKTAEESIALEGGSKNDTKVLTNLITKENLKDFINKNLMNFLGFANGKNKTLLVYIPYKIIPKELLPTNLLDNSETIPLTDFISKYKVAPISKEQIQTFSILGISSTLIFILLTAVLISFLMFLFLLTKTGSRLIAPAIALVLAGGLSATLATTGQKFEGIIGKNLSQGSSFAQITLTAVANPLLTEIFKLWLITGGVLIILGIVLIFLKKQ